jgi:hypothetical protein
MRLLRLKGEGRNFLAIVAVAAAVLAAPGSFAQQGPPEMSMAPEERRVLAVEDEYVAAEVSRDEEALRRLVDDRFVQNSPNGTTSGKEALIQAVLRMRMAGQTVRERSVLIEGDLALIFGTADMRFADPGKEDRISSLRYTATYVKRNGQWRMLALQMQQRSRVE